MASTSSINPTQLSARQTEGGHRFDAVLFATLDALEEHSIPFGIIGGVAASGLGRPRSTHDIDVFVRPEDAEAALVALEKRGFRIDRTDIEWLFKAYKDDILVDVVFRSKGDLYFDEEMQKNRKMVEYHGRKLPLVSPEDLAILKCAVHTEGGPHHWHDALAILSYATIDWEYLLKRARRAPRRLLALLLYAQSSDILIPNYVIFSLYEYIFGDYREKKVNRPEVIHKAAEEHGNASPGISPEYLAAHIRESLTESGHIAQQDLKILVSDRQILVKGDCPSEERCKVIEEVVRKMAPGYHILNQLRVVSLSAPERVEEIS